LSPEGYLNGFIPNSDVLKSLFPINITENSLNTPQQDLNTFFNFSQKLAASNFKPIDYQFGKNTKEKLGEKSLVPDLTKRSGTGTYPGLEPGNTLQSFLGKEGVLNVLGNAPEVIDAGLNLAGAKQATIKGLGDDLFSKGTTALWKGALQTGNPYAIAAAGVLKGVDYLNRYAGKNTKKQGTDQTLNTGGYNFQLSENAGQKTTLSKRK